jgi:hypothetical protein
MLSASHKILLGLLQLLSGISALIAFVVAAVLVVIVVYSLIRGARPRLMARAKWFRFITCGARGCAVALAGARSSLRRAMVLGTTASSGATKVRGGDLCIWTNLRRKP